MGLEVLVKSSMILAKDLEKNGPGIPKDLAKRVHMQPRTLSFAIKKLHGLGIIKKIPNLQDMRCPIYAIDEGRWKDYTQSMGPSIDYVYRTHMAPYLETGVFREFKR
jgi:DNA-binding Lrp family transcriptional regulator